MYERAETYKRLRSVTYFATAILLAILLLLAINIQKVHAAGGQGGVQQITLNPGGGIETNGSDGLRFTINADINGGWPGPDYAGWAGQDAVAYRNTVQYCCSAGGPMLNIGGTLYGQAGPANNSANWNSIEIINTSGMTSVGARTASKGNSSAVVRYTAIQGGLTYTVTRTVNYTYPNEYVTDSYSFVIPDGNADVVKFYLGGDTAPGSSDSGYGVMLTEPVRSVISLNVSSQIMFGFREVSGSKPFDGATSQSFYDPYQTVADGNDIGFIATGSVHDAGLMMQWNLGSTPGTQTASLQQFASQQGTNLNAGFSSNTTDINVSVPFSASIVNTELTQLTGLGYTIALPAGLVIGTGSQVNTCGGTVTTAVGSSSIILSGGTVSGASNCVVTVPVLSSAAGTYSVSSTNISGLEGALINNVGASSLTVSNPELGTDLNDDDIDDADQSNVFSYTSSVTDKTVVLEVSDSCSVNSATSVAESANEIADNEYDYLNGLMDFSLSCGTPGFTSTIKQYYYDVPASDLVLRKYDPNTQTYTTIEGATVEEIEINGNLVTVVTYEVTDGGELDTDGVEDGNIADPAGLATDSGQSADQVNLDNPTNSTTDTNLAETGQSATIYILMSVVLISSGCLMATRYSSRNINRDAEHTS